MSSSEPSLSPSSQAVDKEAVLAKHREVAEAKHKAAVQVANFEAAKRKAEDLSAFLHTELGKRWVGSLVPKDDKDGATLNAKLNDCLERGIDDDDVFEELKTLIKDTQEFYENRINMYTAVLTDETHGEDSTRQICILAGILDNTFQRGYTNIFETWIKIGDKPALDEWTAWAQEESARLKSNRETMTQNVNTMDLCYEAASKKQLQDKYIAFVKKVADETGGVFVLAVIKSPMRAVEKTALKKDEKIRYKCENVYDVIRAAIKYGNMRDFKRGAEMICNSEDFEVLKLKDRLTEGQETSSGWRDGLINGRFKKGRHTHVVEIQVHHIKLVSIREDLGGHHLYVPLCISNMHYQYIHICIYIYICTCTYIHTHTPTQIHIHMYSHIDTYDFAHNT
jgi:hypothetical protein